MTTSFYTNSSEVKFINELRERIDHCSAFRFSSSFIKKRLYELDYLPPRH